MFGNCTLFRFAHKVQAESLPTRLLNPRYHAFIGVFAKADAAQPEISHKPALATATKTATYDTGRKFWLLQSACSG